MQIGNSTSPSISAPDNRLLSQIVNEIAQAFVQVHSELRASRTP